MTRKHKLVYARMRAFFGGGDRSESGQSNSQTKSTKLMWGVVYDG